MKDSPTQVQDNEPDIPIGRVFYGAAQGKVVIRTFGPRAKLKGAASESRQLDITNFEQNFGGDLRQQFISGELIEAIRFSDKLLMIDLKDKRSITLQIDGHRLYRAEY